MTKIDLEDMVSDAIRHIVEQHCDLTEKEIQLLTYEMRVAFREAFPCTAQAHPPGAEVAQHQTPGDEAGN